MAKASWKDDLKKQGREWSESDTFKPREGDNTVRILPNASGSFMKKGAEMMPPIEIYYAHPNVGKNKRFLRCGKDNEGGGKCWLCDVKIKELEGKEKESLRAKAQDMKPIRQGALQVAYKEDEKWRGPKTWFLKIGRKALGNRLLAFITSATRDYDDPVNGYNIVFQRTGSGMNTDYGPLQAEEESSKVPKSILEKLKSFDDIVPDYSKSKQEAAYLGREEEEAPADDDEEETAPEDDADTPPDDGEETPKKKKKPVDDDEEATPEDDDEETPKKKAKKPADDEDEESGDDDKAPPNKKKKPVDDEDEEEAEPEEDEEETPKKKAKKPVADEDEEEVEEAPKKKGKKPADEEDEEAEPEADEEEEEAPPKKKAKKPVDEEDEEEAPKKKAKKKLVDEDDD